MPLPLNTNYRNQILTLCVVLAAFIGGLFPYDDAYAFTPSAQQIEQFKRLPRSEQERLARDMGVDLSQMQATSTPPVTYIPQDQSQPRSTAPDYKSTLSESKEANDGAQKQLKMYGYDLFENNAEAFMPSVDMPVPSDYVIGPGDTLVVQLYGKDNANYNFVVSREGMVQFPEIGPVALAGLTFTQVQEMINKTVSEQMIGVKSSVTMGAIRSIRIFVLGEAVQPGSYVVSSLSTMTNALFSSGGITKIGSLRNVQLKRKGKVITTLDLYDLLLNGDTSKDARLLSGDVIFIPPIGKTVSIDGEIKRPATYELKNEATAKQVLALAGGLLPTAYPSESKIERINKNGDRTVVDLNLSSATGQNTAVQSADLITVYPVLEMIENVVVLKGHVKRPGLTSWKPGVRVADVIGSIESLLPNPDLKSAIIERETQPARRLEIIIFNPGDALSNPAGGSNIALKPKDTITLFNLTENRSNKIQPLVDRLRQQADRDNPERIVSITGNVRFPGEYPLAQGMTSQDLILLAGGLTQNAYNLDAEITRYSLDAAQKRQVNYQTVSLINAENFILKEHDTLNVRRLPDWAPEESMQITGEVMFPGKYTIKRGETLSQIIKRAGGLTDQAYPGGAVFTRQELKQLEEQRLIELKQKLESDIAASNVEQQDDVEKVDLQDAQQLLKSISSVKPLGRMVIDLPLVLATREQKDIRIFDGDTIFIPRYKQSVTVVGEVQYPTSHLYEKDLNVQEYIERSGGTNLKADKKRVYVVKANGRVFLPSSSGWFSRSAIDVEPGDTVVVPLDADRIKSLTLWASVSEIFYQIALGAAAVASF